MGTELGSTEHLACLSLALNTSESPRRWPRALQITTEIGHWHWDLHWDSSIVCDLGGIAISKTNVSEEPDHAGLDWHY